MKKEFVATEIHSGMDHIQTVRDTAQFSEKRETAHCRPSAAGQHDSDDEQVREKEIHDGIAPGIHFERVLERYPDG